MVTQTNPRQINLRAARLWTPSLATRSANTLIQQIGIDVLPNIMVIDIYESIFQNTITAEVQFRETTGFSEYLPLVGTEALTLSFAIDAPTLGEDEKVFTRTFRIFRVRDQTYERNEIRSFTLDLVTPEFFVSTSSRICKRYTGQTVVAAIKDIMERYLEVPITAITNATFENTSGNIDVIIPNYTPLKAINYLSALALTEKSPAESNFVFYETLDGFFFTSIRKLIEQGKAVSESARASYKVSANEITGSDKVDAKTALNSIIRIHQDELFDTLRDITTGMLRSKMLNVDFFGRTWKEDDTRYTTAFQEHTHLDDFPMYPENFDESVSKNVKIFTVPSNTSIADSAFVQQQGEQMTRSSLFEAAVKRNRQMKEIQHLRTLLEVPGRPDIRSGSVIRITYPSSREIQGLGTQYSSDNVPQTATPYYSGLHMITHIRHSILRTDVANFLYTMHLEVTRDSFGAPMPKFESIGS